MSATESTEIVNETIELRAGQEWHSTGLKFEEGQTVLVRAIGNGRFYAGFYSRDSYFKKRDRPNPFPFTFGSDRSQFTTKAPVKQTDYYYVVLRVGVFAQKARIHLLITLE